LATGLNLRSHSETFQAAEQLLSQLDLEASIITLDKDGMALAHRDGLRKLFPTRPRQVYDITGAGDMVLSVFGMALSVGVDYDAAIRLANIAGGLEVEKIGVATVTRDEILRDLLRAGSGSGSGQEKLLTRESLRHELESRRRLGQQIAFTNGCFDVLHAGHVQYLQEEFASVWEKNPQKLFAPNPAPQPGAIGPDGQPMEIPDQGGQPGGIPPAGGQGGGMPNLSPRIQMPNSINPQK